MNLTPQVLEEQSAPEAQWTQTEAGAIPASQVSDAGAKVDEDEPTWRAALRERGRQWREQVAKRFVQARIPILSARRQQVQEQINEIPRRMQRVTNQATLVLELVDDFRTGRYRKLPWHSMAIASGALLYAVSPADAVPDVIPLIGALDDMFVITVAMRVLRKDLRTYCLFKGYDPDEYF